VEVAGTEPPSSGNEQSGEEPSDPAFQEETFELGSEELGSEELPSGEGEEGVRVDGQQEEALSSDVPTATTSEAESGEESSLLAVVPVREESSVAAMHTGWPLQVAAVMPDMDPPRAILRLPDGRELVVKAGTMLPEAGIVVVSIGKRAVSLAKVLPEGDHARIEGIELLSQN
jgi:type IV pilus biogenesis protein PilP